MSDFITGFLLKFIMLAPPILLALSVHESAHAGVAYLRGDPTAVRAKRFSLNPIRHLDIAGTVIFFVTAWFGAGIGWAKPVPVDTRNLPDPRHDHMLISAAGPVSNVAAAIVVAVVFNLLINAGFFTGGDLWKYILGQMFILGVHVNVILAFFNLIPLPPLDGSGILAGLLSPKAAYRYYQMQRYGFLILLALIFLPRWLPGFPDIIGILVLWPANSIVHWLLPV